MTEIKTILLIGRSGRGKSTIANVVVNTDKFKESAKSVSETKKIQFEQFEDEDNKYLVIDTPGIGDTKLKDNQVLDIIAEAVYLAKNGVSQVFFVTDGRFDQYEMATYDLLRTIIFDSDITKYTTIVRTRFPDFRKPKKCEEDVGLMAKEAQERKTKLERSIAAKEKEIKNFSVDNEQHQKLLKEVEQLKKQLTVTNLAEIIESCQGKIVYVDNPSLEIKSARDSEIKIRKNKRDKSRKILLEHLSNNCQTVPYKPPKLQALSNEIAEDYFEYLKKKEELQKELESLKNENFAADQKLSTKTSDSEKLEPLIEKEKLAVEGEDSTKIIKIQEVIAQLQDKKERLKKEIQEKEKVIRQKVLKHIFNNYQAISQELGGDIFLDSVVGDYDWQKIDKEFINKELVVKWLSHGFDYQQTQMWANALGSSFDPKIDAGFCAWLRDNKKLTVEKIKVNYSESIEQLRKEYANWLVKETEMLAQHNQQLSFNWTAIHEDFAQEWYGETYQREWEKEGLTYQDAQEWINAGFNPRDYLVVKRWKGQEFTAKEAQKWIKTGLKPSECELVVYLKKEGYQPVNIDLKEVRKKFAVWLDSLKEDAQTYLNREYPLSKRGQITELDVSKKNLTGSLKLDGFNNLTIFDCSINQLTSLEFVPFLNPTKLKWLSIGDNNLPGGDLTVFSTFINLEGLNIGSPYQTRVHWTGSLQPLQPLTNLRYLDIKNADLSSGLEYLPESLTEFYCGGTKLAEELETYGTPNEGNYIDSGKNYINLLLVWKQTHQSHNQQSQILQTPPFKPPR